MKNVQTTTSLQTKHLLLLLACCGMVAASVGLCVNAYGVFYTPLSAALGAGRAAVTLHSTISGIITGLLSPAIVKLSERVPLRRIVCPGIVLSSLSFVLMAFAPNVVVLNLCGVLRGIGNSCFYMPIVTVVLGNWFKKGQGTIVGLVMSFSGVAGAVLSPVLSGVIAGAGYRYAALLSAVVIAVPALPLCALFLSVTPGEQNCAPYGEATSGTAAPPRMVNRFSMRSPVFLLLGVVTFLSVTITGLTSHLSGYAESIQAGSEVGALMISAVMVGNILSKFCSGILSDKIGVYRGFSLMFGIALAGLLLLWLGSGTGVLLVASFLFGAIYAASAVGLPAIVRHIYGDKQYGQAYAIISIISVVAPSLTMTAIGALYDATGHYTVVLVLFALFAFAALLLWNLTGQLAQKRNDTKNEAPAAKTFS